jgi:hypothetical protein
MTGRPLTLLFAIVLAAAPNGADEIRSATKGKKEIERIQKGFVGSFDRKELMIRIPAQRRGDAPLNNSPETSKVIIAEYFKQAGQTIPLEEQRIPLAGSVLEIRPSADAGQGPITNEITNSTGDEIETRDLMGNVASNPPERDLTSCKGDGVDWIVWGDSTEQMIGTVVKIEKGFVYFTKKGDKITKQYLMSHLSSIVLGGCL